MFFFSVTAEDKLSRVITASTRMISPPKFVEQAELIKAGSDFLKLPADLSDDLADCAVQRFSEANFGKINNKNGFLMGIIRRVKADGPDRSGGDLDSLSRPIRYKLHDLIDEVNFQCVPSTLSNF